MKKDERMKEGKEEKVPVVVRIAPFDDPFQLKLLLLMMMISEPSLEDFQSPDGASLDHLEGSNAVNEKR